MEAMGLQLPGGSFVNPDAPLREALTQAAAEHITRITRQSGRLRALGKVLDERSFVNAVVALLASGGSTNHSIHLIAMARAAGLIINWDDFDELSGIVPLLCRIYPNGQADINHFQAAGGTSYLFAQLFEHGLMHADAQTMWGDSLADYTQEPKFAEAELRWSEGCDKSLDTQVLTNVEQPFDPEGGLRLLQGNLGRGVIKVSAVAAEHRSVCAPAVVVDDQDQLKAKFDAGELDRDCVVVVRFQGPSANGMPELHKLTPILGSLQDRGFAVALVTDGRMSGASGKIPAAIHVSPEAAAGGPLAFVKDGDVIALDAASGRLECQVEPEIWSARQLQSATMDSSSGIGREYFGVFRQAVTGAEEGASVLFPALAGAD